MPAQVSIELARRISPAPRLLRGRVLRGFNAFHRSTVFRQRVDLGALAGLRTTDAGPDFAERLFERFASLETLAPSGGPSDALAELAGPAGVPLERALLSAILAVELHVAFTMRRFDPPEHAQLLPRRPPSGIVDLVWECHAASLSRAAARVAFAGLVELLPPSLPRFAEPPRRDFAARLAKLRRRALRRQWTPSAAVLALAAKRSGLPCECYAGAYLRIGDGILQHVLSASASGFASRAAGGARPTHHLLVVGGTVVSALRVDAPEIRGDGTSTIAQLVDRLNDDPRRDGLRLRRIEFDDALRASLAERGRRLADVLRPEECIPLDCAGTIERGAVHTDVTGTLHADYRDAAVRAAVSRGLEVAGVDITAPDQAQPCARADDRIHAVREHPDLGMHALPGQGEPKDVGRAVLVRLVPPGTSARVPTALIVGRRGTESLARDLDGLLRAAGRVVGLVTRRRTTIAGQPLDPTSVGRRGSAKFVLRDPRVELLVNADSPGRILDRGLRLDGATVTAILDPEPGADVSSYRSGVDVAVAATTGFVVIGAGNPRASRVGKALRSRRLVVSSTGRRGPALLRHLASGGSAVLRRSSRRGPDTIELRRGRKTVASVSLASLGLAADRSEETERGVRRWMYALALAFGLGLSGREIVSALERQRFLRR